MRTTIYVCTHKDFIPPPDTIYQPLQVGAALHKDLGFLRDDTGDNISVQNPYYSELTGLYWIWKNDTDSDIIGIAHYRRFLLNESKALYTGDEICHILQSYDFITTKLLTLDYSYYDAFGGKHHRGDLDVLAEVIRQYRPSYYEDFTEIIHQNRTFFGNMFLMKRKLYAQYMEFLFPVLFAAQKQIDMTGYNNYQKRLYGFFSEVLLYVWTKHNHLRYWESLVGMVGEKTETRQLREELEKLLMKKEFSTAKNCFLEMYAKRPDILMEASDIHGDLKLLMQAITTLEWENKSFGTDRLDKGFSIDSLLAFYRELNTYVRTLGKNTSFQAAKERDREGFFDRKEVNAIEYAVAQKVAVEARHH